MSTVITVDDLVDQVRSQLDEENIETVTPEDILQSLNRGQNYAANILARHYEEPLLKHVIFPLTANQNEYDIPEDAFEQRIEKLEVTISNLQYDLQRISFRDVSVYETDVNVSVPYYYAIVGQKFRVIPQPTGTFPLRMWYLEDPASLVKSWGRITKTNLSDGNFLVDSINSDVTTETDDLNSYFNIVDAQTGKLKGTFQVKTTSDNRITIKTSPTRTSVLNKTIGTNLEEDADGNDREIQPDDHICSIRGTAVPVLKKPFTNFFIQYAVAEITRKLGGSYQQEEIVKQDLMKQVERMWVGQEQQLRVSKRSRHWGFPARNYYLVQPNRGSGGGG